MDAKCTLVPSTLKVYEWVYGAWSPLADKDYSSKVEQVKDETGSRTKLTLKVPDKKYLQVEYEVIPTGNPGNKVPLSNTAMLTGVKVVLRLMIKHGKLKSFCQRRWQRLRHHDDQV